MPPTAVEDDGTNRQIIADRYRRLPGMRRNIKRSALVQLAYICVRTLWHSVPYLTGEEPLTATTEWIFYAGVALFLMRPWAFGFGRAQRERLGAIMLYSICGMFLMAEIFLVFYQYYIDWGMMGRRQGWQYPQMLAKHLAPRIGWSMASMVTVGQWFERAIDTVGISATLINVYLTKEYVMEMKEDKKDKAELAEGKHN